ncbi:SCO family protein [Altererythrobacter sp. H2]|uniref:SCO family protein n=1 Tax=Altererythrobacter sp. H2 TaxID=3108391 RepID=UPI002B4BB8B6|nr:SCO family protein [Altererythrobacter sp. H2]WRK95425.1 SCO family protein [Altererythrobacter sp. H2]
MPTPLRILALSALLPLAACAQGPAQPPLAEAPLAGARIGGDFTLTGEDGQPVSWTDFNGKWRVVYFGFAYCPDICPTDLQRSSQGLALYARDQPQLAAQIQPIFITIDPERDTPEVVAEFTDAFSKDLIGLTGTPEQIAAAAKAFGVYFAKGEVNEQGAYMMDHSNVTYLFDPQGEPVSMLPTDQGAEAVAAELAKWVR